MFAQQDSLSVQNNKVQFDKTEIVQREFDTDNLNDYKKNKDFNYEVKKRQITLIERVLNWLQRVFIKLLSWIFGNKAATGILAIIAQIFPYLIAAVVLFLILKFFLKVNINNILSGKTNKAIISPTDDEELIKNEDLAELIRKAIEQKNYRLAIRYYYLLALQKLSNQDLIDWQQEKTNEDYIKEIKQEPLKNKFTSSTYLYDFVWYGNFDINELEFAKAETAFNELNKLIR